MGVAAYNRGSRAIADGIARDFEAGRGECDARTVAMNAREVIDRMAEEIRRLRRKLLLAEDGKTRNHRAWCELDADFRQRRRLMAGMVRRLIKSNTETESQRLKLARCVREHLTPEQWLAWSAIYDATEKENG